MSHSDALSRLTIGNTRSDMIMWVLRRAIDKVEREWTALLAAAALVGGFGLATPAAAYLAVQPAAATVYTMGPGRIGAAVAAVAGLIGAVIGGLALARSAGRVGNGTGRRGAIVALVLGPIALVIGGLVV